MNQENPKVYPPEFLESAVKWNAAQEEARHAMIDVAKRGSVISYSDLIIQVRSCSLEPSGTRLTSMLREISLEENKAGRGRGMLTVVVVHKMEDKMPGTGFFKLAQSLGRTIVDKEEFWKSEQKKVYAAWSEVHA